MNPYALDFTAEAWAAEFVKGVVEGDIIEDPSIPALIGQIAGGMAPVVGTVADVRNTIVNAARGDWGMAAMSAIGFVPVGGDISKAAANITQFIAKNSDNASQIAELIIVFSKKSSAITRASFDDLLKLIPASSLDELYEAFEKSNRKISREYYLKVIEIAKNAGKKIPTTIDDFPNAKVKSLKDVWTEGICVRGKKIDDLLNEHTLGNGLGEYFPVVDRLEGDVLISTKSLDLGSKTYLDPDKLRNRLQNYIDKLKNFEHGYPKVKTEKGLSWGINPITQEPNKALKITDYNSKKLELVLPDMPMTAEQAEVINSFINDHDISIVIVKG